MTVQTRAESLFNAQTLVIAARVFLYQIFLVYYIKEVTMDILNFISWIKGGRVVNTVDPAKTLLPVGLKDNRRDDGYLAGAISVEDLAAQLTPTPTYKVFTALLTQSGGYFLDQLDSSTVIQNVTKGTTYTIINASDGDFTNVGAPNNNDGTSFIATNNNVPNTWGQDGAGLLFNTGAPVATVLENTIGNVWFAYVDEGRYDINSSLLFTQNKTTVLNGGGQDNGDISNPGVVYSLYSNENSISIWTFQNSSPILQKNNVLINTMLEIRVYE